MKALTGNRLGDGEAVFLGHSGEWVPRFADAELFEDDDAAMAAEAHAKTQITIVVDPYLIDVIAPGFVADCLETLEEIAMEGRATFLGAGGREFFAVPCLNEDPAWIEALAYGWPDLPAFLAAVSSQDREP